jgi:phage gp29-like protein
MIREKLQKFLGWLVPQQTMTIHRLEGVPIAIGHEMSADRIHQILRASENGQSDEYLALVRDIVTGDGSILTAFTQRKTRLLSKPWKISSKLTSDVDAERNNRFCTEQLEGCEGLFVSLCHLLDASFWPVAVVEKTYALGTEPGVRFRLAKLTPVPHHLLDFRQGILRIKETGPDGYPTGQLLDADPQRYVIHRGHLLQSLPDCWGGPARAAVFWWFIAASARGWWTQGVERNGVPFLVGKYDAANPADRLSLLDAFRASARTFGLALSRETEVEVFKDMASGDAATQRQLLEFAQEQVTRLIAGQTMTSKAATAGIGGGQQADVQDSVLTDLAQFDAVLLGATLDEQVLRPLLRLNSLEGPVPAISWQVASEDAQEIARVLETLAKAGIRLRPEALASLSETVGYPVALDGVQGGNAAADGVPVDALPAAMALNGAQTKALSDLVSAVTTGTLPYPSALNTARAAFPDIADDILLAIFEPAREFRPAVALSATLSPPHSAGPLSRAFRGTLAPVRRLIETSTGPEDLTSKLAAFYADLPVTRLAALTAEALEAQAADTAARFRR